MVVVSNAIMMLQYAKEQAQMEAHTIAGGRLSGTRDILEEAQQL